MGLDVLIHFVEARINRDGISGLRSDPDMDVRSDGRIGEGDAELGATPVVEVGKDVLKHGVGEGINVRLVHGLGRESIEELLVLVDRYRRHTRVGDAAYRLALLQDDAVFAERERSKRCVRPAGYHCFIRVAVVGQLCRIRGVDPVD